MLEIASCLVICGLHSHANICLSKSIIVLQAREKFLSLRKGTRSDVATILEEVNHQTCHNEAKS